MKRKSYLTSAFIIGSLLLGSLPMQATDHTIKLVTANATGTEMTLLVNYTYAGVTVDWGDGNAVAYSGATDDKAFREITGTVLGSTITITGSEAWDMLSCANCGLTSIDLSAARDFRSLYAQNNALTTIDLCGMTELVDLNLANNQISAITYTSSSNPERDLAKIENINLADNQLSGTFVIRTSTLRTIDVSNNSYSTLYTTYNTNLDALKCSNNNIRSLSLSNNTALTTLVCDNNVLTSLSLSSSLTTMRQLICDDNSITSRINLENCTALTDLSCASNSISTLYLPAGQTLYTLNVSDNKLNLGVLPKKANRPNYVSFMPQALVDISGLDNVETKDGVYYIPLSTWDTRTASLVDLTDYRYIGQGSSTTGSVDGIISWYSEDAEGNATALTAGTNSSNVNDYYASGAKYAFFTAQGKAFARIASRSAYSDVGFYVETIRVAIGDDVTGIDNVTDGSTAGLQLSTAPRTLTMSSASPVDVKVISLDGKSVWSGTIGSSVTVTLPSGIYLVNGEKVAL